MAMYKEFGILPDSVLFDKSLRANAKIMIAYLSKYATEKKPYTGSNRDIAESLGITELTVTSILSDLERRGYIERLMYPGNFEWEGYRRKIYLNKHLVIGSEDR